MADAEPEEEALVAMLAQAFGAGVDQIADPEERAVPGSAVAGSMATGRGLGSHSPPPGEEEHSGSSRRPGNRHCIA